MARTPEQEAEYQALLGETGQAPVSTGRSPEQEAEYQALKSSEPQPEAAPTGPRYGEAIKSGLTGTFSMLTNLAKKTLPQSIQADIGVRQAEDLMARYGPKEGFSPKGTAEHLTQFGAGFADVPGMVLGGAIGKAVAPAIKGFIPKLGTLGEQVAVNMEHAINMKELDMAASAKIAADNAYKAIFAKKVIEGGTENALQGALTTGAQSYSQGDSAAEIALKTSVGGVSAALLGSALGAGSARLGKKNYQALGQGFSEKVVDTRTPGMIALDEQIAKNQVDLERVGSAKAAIETRVDYPSIAQMKPSEFDARVRYHYVDPETGVGMLATTFEDAVKKAGPDGQIRLGVDDGKQVSQFFQGDGPEVKALVTKLRTAQSHDPMKLADDLAPLLQKNEELAMAQQGLVFQGRQVSRENIPGIFKQQTQQSATENARQQAAKVFALGEKGLIPKDQVSTIAKAEFDNALEKQLVTRDGFSPVAEGTWRLGHEAASKIDDALGTNLSGAHITMIGARNQAKNLIHGMNSQDAQIVNELAKTGLAVDREMASILRYVETDPATRQVIFNKTASQNPLNIRPAYDGPELTPQQVELFSQLRLGLDAKRAQYAAEVGEIGQVPGYLPIRNKEVVVGVKKGVESTLAPKAAQSRETGYWDPTLHETHMMKILSGYNQEVGRAIALKPAIDEGLKQAALLQLVGDANALGFWKRQLADGFGISKTRDLEDMFGKAVYKDLEPQLLKVIAQAGDPELMKGELVREFSKAFYTNKVLLNPKNQMLQFFQPELIGFGEIGKYATKGRFRDKETQLAVDDMLKQAYHANTGGVEDFGRNATPKGLAAKGVHYLNAPGKALGGGIQNASEKQNRMAILGGAYQQWSDAYKKEGLAGVTPLLERLLPGQRVAVEKAFNEHGQEAAKRQYAIITSDRANFSYDLINRPQALRNEVGNNIPFLTFGLNSLERLATDLKGKQTAQLVRRFAPAIVASYAISLVTNDKRQLKGIDPASSAVGVLSPNVNPVISTAVDTYQQRSLGQGLQKLAGNVTPYEPAKGLYDTINKHKYGENTLNAFGIKKKKPDALDAVTKSLKRMLR